MDQGDEPEEEESSAPPDDDEVRLFKAYASGHSPEIQEQIVTRYSGLVVSIVRKFRGRAEWEDLVQVGYLGMLKAIQGFKPSSGNRFSTYATHCITGELRHYLRDRTEVVRKPRWLQSVSRQVSGFVEQFLQNNERLPTVSEISEGCNITRDGVVEVLRAGQTVSLEQLQQEASNGSLQLGRIKSLREETFVLTLEDRIWLETALERLVEAERNIVKLFFYKDLNQSQIASQTGLPAKRVSRIMRKALDRMKSVMRLHHPEDLD